MKNKEYKLGGVDFTYNGELHLLSGYDSSLSLAPMSIPANLVSGLVNASYAFPEHKQSILDALSPFQLMSKFWVSSVLGTVLTRMDVPSGTAGYASQFVFPGSWYGQQLSLLRRNSSLSLIAPILVDLDPVACDIANALGRADPYGFGTVRDEHTARVHNLDIFSPEYQRLPIVGDAVYVWNGLEHFDPALVKKFVSDRPGSIFCVQGTNMVHRDGDHVDECLVSTTEELYEKFFPEDRSVLFEGTLSCFVGDRFMLVVDKHRVDDGS